MKIKRIEILGFKSFADVTQLELTQDICCVVGPNGCGKSNIVDAVKWALGEQSLKALRAHTSEDLIFSGTETKKPLGYAEVTLTFDNSQKLAPPPFSELSEIAVTRRIYRDGESEFYINRRPARLKHIQDLFMNTGASKGAYSVVEQGEIEHFIEAKPEERRKLLEEAAGIAKFHAQKEETLRKIERTKQDLDRINDILSEQEHMLRSLKRQANKAERYHQLKRELRDVDLQLTACEFRASLKSLSNAQRELASTTATCEGLKAQKGKLALEIQNSKLALSSIENEVEQIRKQKSDMESELAALLERDKQLFERQGELEKNLANLSSELARIEQELIETKGKREQYQSSLQESQKRLTEEKNKSTKILNEIEELENKRSDIQKTSDELFSQKSSIQQKLGLVENAISQILEQLDRAKNISTQTANELEENRSKQEQTKIAIEELTKKFNEALEKHRLLRKEVEENKKRLKELKSEAESKKEAFERTKEKLNRRTAELATLKEMERNLEGYQRGVKAILERSRQLGQSSEIKGVLADFIETEPDYEVAVEVVLGERLQSILVDQATTGISAIEYLKEHREGRSNFIPTELKLFETENNSQLISRMRNEYGLIPLGEKVKTKKELKKLIDVLLDNVYVVENLNRAKEIMESDGFPPEFKLVTPDGEIWEKRGIISGGTPETPSSGLLKNKRTIKLYETEVAWLQIESERTQTELLRTQGLIDRLEEKIRSSESEINELERYLVELSSAKEKQELILSNLKESEKSLLQLMESSPLVPSEKLEPLKAQKEELSSQLEQLDQKLKAVKDELNELNKKLNSKLVEQRENEFEKHKLENQIASLEGKLSELDSYKQNLENQSLLLHEQIEELKAKQKKLQKEKDDCEHEIKTFKADLEKINDELNKKLDEYKRVLSEIDYLEKELQKVSEQIEKLSERANQLKLEQERIALHKNNMVEQIKSKYNEDIERVFHSYPEVENLEELKLKKSELEDKLNKLGEVNPLADKEYKELNERYEFLSKQKADLEEAIENLKKAIKKIDQTSRELLKQTLESVNEKFQQVIPILFPGGKGEVKLQVQEEGQDILDAGLEVNVQPQGKRLRSMDLLSGGEKALAALGFIAALFLTRPAPFCILDEVDAPLDEANVDRFKDLVKLLSQHSQILLITHNRRTMEMVDVLYGVTMEEPGVSKLLSVTLSDIT